MEEEKFPQFKKSTGTKKRMWKSLKQILATEKNLQWEENAVTYTSINALPSFKPAKKYSDISGLIAKYTDPTSKLHFHNSEEFATVRSLQSDLISGYLLLRGASSIV